MSESRGVSSLLVVWEGGAAGERCRAFASVSSGQERKRDLLLVL